MTRAYEESKLGAADAAADAARWAEDGDGDNDVAFADKDARFVRKSHPDTDLLAPDALDRWRNRGKTPARAPLPVRPPVWPISNEQPPSKLTRARVTDRCPAPGRVRVDGCDNGPAARTVLARGLGRDHVARWYGSAPTHASIRCLRGSR